MHPKQDLASDGTLKGIVSGIFWHDHSTVIALTGCPLRCKWCGPRPSVVPVVPFTYYPARCDDLRPSAEPVTNGLRPVKRPHPCNTCLGCVRQCPQYAAGGACTIIAARDLLAHLAPTPEVIIAGSEPLYQKDFSLALIDRLPATTAVVLHTSGYSRPEVVEDIVPRCQRIVLDLKHMDPTAHLLGTGADNRMILDNAVYMARHTELQLSLPLIERYNTERENLAETARFARALDIRQLHLYPLEWRTHLNVRRIVSPARLQAAADFFRGHGLEVSLENRAPTATPWTPGLAPRARTASSAR